MRGLLTIAGHSGQEYQFLARPFGESLPESPGVYVITHATRSENGEWLHTPLCIGRAENLSRALHAHPESQCLDHQDANVICFRIEHSAEYQARVVRDLVEQHQPRCQCGDEGAGE